uniref:lysozyme n=1 Tax=Culicoides sonorensis TaxID=179676 RepID=A0A336LUH1_CULSO
MISVVNRSNAKYYNTVCDKMDDIMHVGNISLLEAAKWSCVTSQSTKYEDKGFVGIFQIGKEWWCSPTGGGICKVACVKFLDDDIRDDFECAMKIYKGHDNTFSAWPGNELCLEKQAEIRASKCHKQLESEIPESVEDFN